MFKKISTFMLILMLTFSPVAPLTANAQEADNMDATEDQVNETEEQANEEEPSSETEEGEKADANETDESDAVEEQDLDTPVADEPAGDDESATEEDETEDPNEETDSEVNEEDEAVEEDEAEEDSVEAQADEDLDLEKISGTASDRNGITYDFNKGYYILDLQAGFYNYGNQVLEDKWVAFALPNGIRLANTDVPSGVAEVSIKGKRGIAVKIPDVGAFPDSKHIYPKIPLVGEMDDNDPVENLYLFDKELENLGQINGQRNIDFSVMEENPKIDLHGSITGSTSYDEKNKYHFLNVNVKALNQTDSKVNDLYVAFELPEDVEVVNDDNTPANMEILNLDGKQAIALKLPNLKQGKEGELTYRIPVVGVSDAVVTSETISVFKILDAGYNEVGQFDGHINVDFSGMDIAWHFDAIAQIIPDYPGIKGDQMGFNFKYAVKNIDVADVEKVKMEFIVPNGIKILKPEYNSGSRVEVDWKGNVATLTFGDLKGASGYEGYFTAVGKTSKSIDELKSMKVKVTLYRDGNEVVETINVPFVVGKYADIDRPIEDDDDNEKPGDKKPGEKPGKKPGDKKPGDNGNDDDNGSNGNGGNNNNNGDSGTGGDGKNNNNGSGDVKVTVEDGDDSAADKQDGTGLSLPKTATNMYTILLIGALTLIAGASLMVLRKRKVME